MRYVKFLLLVLFPAIVLTCIHSYANTNSNIPAQLNQPGYTNAEIMIWAARKVQDTLHFDYDDYRGQLGKGEYNFTSTGWGGLTSSLKQMNIIGILEENMDGVRVTINAAPEIVSSKLVLAQYTWDLKFPITITFTGRQPPQSKSAILNLRIIRVPASQNDDGIAFDNWTTTLTD